MDEMDRSDLVLWLLDRAEELEFEASRDVRDEPYQMTKDSHLLRRSAAFVAETIPILRWCYSTGRTGDTGNKQFGTYREMSRLHNQYGGSLYYLIQNRWEQVP